MLRCVCTCYTVCFFSIAPTLRCIVYVPAIQFVFPALLQHYVALCMYVPAIQFVFQVCFSRSGLPEWLLLASYYACHSDYGHRSPYTLLYPRRVSHLHHPIDIPVLLLVLPPAARENKPPTNITC